MRSIAALAPYPLLIVAVGLTGCAGNGGNTLIQSLSDAVAPKVTFKLPARSAEAGALRSVIIVTDNTEIAQQIGLGLESSMSKLKVDEKPQYTNVKLGPRVNGLPGDAQIVALARNSGVDGVILVTGGGSDLKSVNSTEDRYSCATDTKLFKACPQGQSRTTKVACTGTTGIVTARLRAFRAADARFVYADNVAGDSKTYRCSDSTTPQVDNRELVQGAMLKATATAMQILAPSYEQAPLDLMSADGGLQGTDQKRFEAALEFARARRMDEACNRFDELYLDHKESRALTFDVAFCQEVRGDMLRANQSYRRASELANAPNAQIDRRLAITEKALRENPTVFLPTGDTAANSASRQDAIVGDGRRVALVIGNARYQRSALVNPVNDARLVSDRLKRVGFDVTTMENVDAARFGTAVRDFASRAKGADIALFYYAGHAIQADGENFLMPVDNARMRSVEDVRANGGVELAEIAAQLDVAAPQVKLLIIDACRDNPLPASSRGMGGGLAAIKQPPQGGLIAFATAPGRTAEDGTGKNSVFSKYFSEQVMVPNQTIEQLFKRVRERVKNETHNRQEPTEVSSLVGEVILVKSK